MGCFSEQSIITDFFTCFFSFSFLYIYMPKCQKVRKSWVKILTVNKI